MIKKNILLATIFILSLQLPTKTMDREAAIRRCRKGLVHDGILEKNCSKKEFESRVTEELLYQQVPEEPESYITIELPETKRALQALGELNYFIIEQIILLQEIKKIQSKTKKFLQRKIR